MKAHLFTLFLLCAFTALFAQSGYYHKVIRLSDEANKRLIHTPSENLGAILLDAYLKGKLTAYKSDYIETITKREVVPGMYPSWEHTLEPYFSGTFVEHKSKYYRAIHSTVGVVPPDEAADDWVEDTPPGTPVAFSYAYPSAADSTMKSSLLFNMIEERPALYPAWYADGIYYANDYVVHNNKIYESLNDNPPKTEPSFDTLHWRLSKPYFTTLQSSDIDIVRILYRYNINSKDTAHMPQMISVLATDSNELSKNVGLNFSYNDVNKYLSEISLPALYNSTNGYLGNGQFIFDEHTKANFILWFLERIRLKELKLDKKWNFNQSELDQLLNASQNDVTSIKWFPVQNPTTLDIRIIAGKTNTDYEYYTILIGTLPWKSIAKFFNTTQAPVQSHDLQNIIRDKSLEARIDSLHIDSLNALPVKPVQPLPVKALVVHDYRFDNIGIDKSAYKLIGELWGVLTDAWLAKRILLQTAPSFYPCHYNFKGVKGDWLPTQTLNDDLTLSHIEQPPTELPPQGPMDLQLGVVYARTITSAPALPQSIPTQLVITFQDKERIDVVTYRFAWNDVKTLLTTKANFNEFVKSCESGSLDLNQSSIAYALTNIR